MMKIQKPMYLIAGGGGRNILSTFHIIAAIVRDVGKEKPTIAYIGVASLSDNWFICLIISGLLRVMCHCQVRRILIAPKNADLDKAKKALELADIVFLSGGDMEAGMKILEEKNMVGFFQELSRKGKLFIGASAGSIMLANEWVNWSNPDDESTAE
ncbi:MAG: Type 1 glutamine amidotransferase-like domain-containing protein, partial [Chloroflexi bacterium]|nr:Type 1 glutamine amidotransferase-like domain-containing protein [Chloroflexota bacterium]